MIEKINQILEGIDIRFQEPLKHYTFTKVGGNAEFLAFPRNQYELKRIVQFANQEQSHGWSWAMRPISLSEMGAFRDLSLCLIACVTSVWMVM